MQIISSTKTANRIPNKLLCLLGKKESLLPPKIMSYAKAITINTIVMISRKTGYAVLFCVYPHGAKL